MKINKLLLSFSLTLLFTINFNNSYAQELHFEFLAPVYKGGFKALQDFIKENNHYSYSSQKEGVQAIVTVNYTINENSKIENIKILRGLNAECDSEAVRITRLITGWQAAVQMGKPIKVTINMPIEFYVKDESPKEQETIIVKGNVSDKVTGNPIEGTLILVKGANIGAVTDKDGNYSIEVPKDELEMEYSSLGYGRKFEKIGKNRTINVQLLPEDIIIDFSSN